MPEAKLRKFNFHNLKMMAGLAALLLAADLIVAYGFSSIYTRQLLGVINRYANARVSFERARIHPLFLSFSASRIQILELDNPQKIVSAERVNGRLDIIGLLTGKIFLSSLILNDAELVVTKDAGGVLSVEKLLRPKGAPSGEKVGFRGWKYKDWLFHLYQRLKYTASGEGSLSETAVFKIRRLQLKGGKLVLRDRLSRPMVFQNVSLRMRDLKWALSGMATLDQLSIGGTYDTDGEGRFFLYFKWAAGRVHALIRLTNLDLALMRPVYASSSPVYFRKGFVTLTSSSRFGPGELYSRNHLKIEGHEIRSNLAWSPESRAVLSALNRHPSLDVAFTVDGTPEQPSLKGLEESLVGVLRNDFDPRTLSIIRVRLSDEFNKITEQFRRA